jgi:hypothetical protein
MSDDQQQAVPGWYPVPEGGLRWWDGSQWSAAYTPPVQAGAVIAYKDPYEVNHILHLLLSVLTCGLWLPIWGLVAWSKSQQRAAAMALERRMREGLPPMR